MIPWIVAAIAVVALVLVVVLRSGTAQPAAPFAAGAPAAGTPPDISQMTPRQQFDRLFERVMVAAEQGDTATVAQFSPMALMAYQNLPSVDADARFHAAMIRLHTGDMPGTTLLADSIAAAQPRHLFAALLHASVARFQQDDAAARRHYADFLAAWDAEMVQPKQEYLDHRPMLDNFQRTARDAVGGANSRP